MSVDLFQIRKQDSNDNLLYSNKHSNSSRKYQIINRHNSYKNNVKILKNNPLPKIYSLGKKNLNSNTNIDESINNIKLNPDLYSKIKSNKILKKISMKKNLIRPLKFENIQTKQILTKINNKNDTLSDIKTNEKINDKNVKNYSASKYKVKELTINKENKNILFKYLCKSPSRVNLENLNSPKMSLNKIEIPNIYLNNQKKREIKTAIKEKKREKDLLINTVNTNESNSFINEIMDIINICTPGSKDKIVNKKNNS
jgi:hypothetical protein